MGVELRCPCRRCGRPTYIHWNLHEEEPPHFCFKCSMLEGLEELVPPRWFGVQLWCWWKTRHNFRVREHPHDLMSCQCESCGYVYVVTHPNAVMKAKLKKQQQRLELAAKADPEYRDALEETNALEK